MPEFNRESRGSYCLGWNALPPWVLGHIASWAIPPLCAWKAHLPLRAGELLSTLTHTQDLRSLLSIHRHNLYLHPGPPHVVQTCASNPLLDKSIGVSPSTAEHSTYLTRSTPGHFLQTLAPSQRLTLPTQPGPSLTRALKKPWAIT